MTPRRPRRDQDSVITAPIGVVRVAVADPAAKTRAPITAPITIRVDHRTREQRRTADALTALLAGRGSQVKLFEQLSRQWGLATAETQTRRWKLYQATLTQVAEASGEWNRLWPKRCGAGERTWLAACTPRDTCSVHREYTGLWQDTLERFVDVLHDVVPVRAAETAGAEQSRTRRRSVQK